MSGQADVDIVVYMEKLESIKDQKIVDNMNQLLTMGYTNYEVNLNLLKRNNNDLISALNSLDNGLISESMFLLVWLTFFMRKPFIDH